MLMTLAFMYSAMSVIKVSCIVTNYIAPHRYLHVLKMENELHCDKFLLFVLQELVFEKQQRLKESMKMMGLANWIHWLAWFTKNLLFLLVAIIIATAFLKVGI